MLKLISSAARELLALERIQKTRPLSDDEQEQWQETVVKIFEASGEDAKKRKSFRFKAETPCAIKWNGKIYESKLFEISLRGFSFETPVTLKCDNDFLFYLESVVVQGEEILLGLECKSVNLIRAKNKQKFGAQFTSRNAGDILSRYADEVYYPFYINFLEKLAAS